MTGRPHRHQVEPAALAAAAHSAAEAGHHVFPLVPGGKRPAVRGWQDRATTDHDRIGRCWAAGYWNIAVACGPSRLVVLDLDAAHDAEAPPPPWDRPGIHSGADVLALVAAQAGQPVPADTYTVRTGNGGRHLYFAAPAGAELRNTAGRLGWRIDTRAAGGYVVAAGSIVNGRPYAELAAGPPVPLPAWLADRLATPPAPATPARPVPATDRLSAYLAAALRAEAQRVSSAAAGQRNHTLYVAAVALGQLVAGGALDHDQALAVLGHASDQHIAAGAYSPRQRDQTIASGLRAGARKPRSVAT